MKYDYYIFKIIWRISYLYGPFPLKDCKQKIKKYAKDPNDFGDLFFIIKVTKGAKTDILSFLSITDNGKERIVRY